jgi:hypothetical protein
LSKIDRDWLREDIEDLFKKALGLKIMSKEILSVWHPTTEHLLDALRSIEDALKEVDGVMDCGVDDIPTTSGCSFCGSRGASSICGCKCHKSRLGH